MTLAGVPLDDQEGEDELEAETPGDGAPADGAAIGGESVGETDKGDETEKSGDSSQGVLREKSLGVVGSVARWGG